MAKRNTLGRPGEANAHVSTSNAQHHRIQKYIRRAIFATLFLSGMSGVFGQDKNCEKKVVQNNTPTNTLANDSIEIGGFKVSSDEAKIYKDFEEARQYYDSDEELMGDYKKRITMNRKKKQLEEKLAAAEKRIEAKKQENAGKTEVEKQVYQENAELKQENEQLKQQLFQAREKKLGRALTDKEKSEILKGMQQTQ